MNLPFAESLERLKESFLWAAAKGGHEEDCLSLLEYGADVNWVNPEGDTALIAACRTGHPRIVELLIVHGADVNKQANDGTSALHCCTQRGDQTLVKLLLGANCDTNAVNSRRQTAQDVAAEKGYTDISAILERHASRELQGQEQGIDASARIRMSSTDIRRRRLPSIPPTPRVPDSETSRSTTLVEQFSQFIANMQSPTRANNGSMLTSNVSDLGARSKHNLESSRGHRTPRAPDTLSEQLQAQVHVLTQEITQLRSRVEHYQGLNIQMLPLSSVEHLEQELRATLEVVVKRKDHLMQEEIAQQREQRLCVVCQEKEKSVVFLPCRHMCVCAACANNERVKTCPLCRHMIETRFSVYA